MKKLIEGLELAIGHGACKGNREAFEKALNKGNKIECYQIAFGNRLWLFANGIIKESDILELEILARGIGKCYNNNGQLNTRINYKNGKYHGLYERWYENGQLRGRINYENGKGHGLCEEWYEDGQLRYHINYKNGKYHGLYEEWDDNGKLINSVNYENGEIVS